jgi:hypothetical protein
MVDDHVRHDVDLRRQRGHVVPGPQARVHLRVIDRIEAGVGAVDRVEERQHVHTAERTGQRSGEEPS